MNTTTIYQEITDQIITLMQENGSDWTRPWTGTTEGSHRNYLTGDSYSGINILLLGLASHKNNYTLPVWATFKQWRMKGGTVRNGEKGTLCVFYKTRTYQQADQDDITIPIAKHFYLFNAEQVDGINIEPAEPMPLVQRDGRIDHFLNSTGAIINEKGNRAFYSPSTDEISIPPIEAFADKEYFYSTLFHELSHWTGHEKRLDRSEGMASRFGDQAYAFEELVAELSSAFLSIQLHVSHEPREDHAKYLNHWLSVLQKDMKAFSYAVSKAQAVTHYLLQQEPLEQEKAA